MAIHPLSVVEDGAILGAGVEIGPFCHVGPRVTLGDGVRLISHVSIAGVTSIGARSTLYPQVAVGGDAQIRGNDFPEGRLVIGDDCVLREMVSMSCGSKRDQGVTTVGARGYFMANSHVGHDCIVGDDVTMANSACLGGHVTIGDRVIFGGVSAVQQFCRVGRGAMVGGLTGINRDVIPYGIAFGDHAELAGLNLIGLKRSGVGREAINALRGAFKLIFYGKDGGVSDRAREARSRWPDVAQVVEVVDFILADAKQELCLARRRGADLG